LVLIYTCDHYVAVIIKCQYVTIISHLNRTLSIQVKESRATLQGCPA
jgi:hypothetical protein